ncbi:MAG: hypothetical protein JSU77_09890 [Fidelibacterota bacterium]|nr:MAG: hypothetical protein JSU77_09890 [Candidatus Neomarinimicrobiota bacterium]
MIRPERKTPGPAISVWVATIAVLLLSTGQGQTIQYMNIGRLQAVFAGNFYESYEHARSMFTNDYESENWLFWPAEYARMDDDDVQGLLGAFGLYLTLPDFTDQNGQHHEYYHAGAWGDRGPYNDRIKMVSEDRYRKWSDPIVSTDGDRRPAYSASVVPRLPSEMVVQNVTHSETGITITRNAYGWSLRGDDDYIIIEYILENTGKVMKREGFQDREVQVSGWPKQLSDVWFALCYRFQPSALGAQHIGNWGAELQGGLGHDARHDYIGETYGQVGQAPEDSLRALISWDGDAEPIDYDDTGNPHVLTGVLLSPQYVGVSVLHTDSSPTDATDDPTQPKTTAWRGEYQDRYAFDQTQWGPPGLADSTVYNYISGGRRDSLTVGQSGLDNLAENHGYFLGFGPYDFGPNESLRIVTAYAAGGISRHRAIEVGQQWKAGDLTDAAKNAILATGKDSLFKVFSRAKFMYDFTEGLTRGSDDLLAPPPPRSLTITSQVNQVSLEWDGSTSEEAPGFAGYRLYRNYRSATPPDPPASLADTLFLKIIEWGVGTENPVIAHSFIDTNITPLWEYDYYLTAFDNQGRESGMFYTLFPQVRPQPGWPPELEGPLSNVMVVPNPHINKSQSWGEGAGRRLMFVGLPAECDIRIYTQSGNLVHVIEHSHDPGQVATGQEEWSQETMSNQNVVSGVYIYTVESDLGNTMGTIVIIR